MGEIADESLELIVAELVHEPLSEGSVGGADPPHRGVPLVGGAQQLGAPVRRVRAVLGEAVLDEQVGDALHALTRHANRPGDLGHGQRLVEHGGEHLPPGGRQSSRSCQRLTDGHEPPVQAEHGLGGSAEQLLLGRHERASL